jgi:branched-chain amino acid aminotransferase
MLASFNLKIFSPDKINLSAVSSHAFYGKGIFTTCAIFGEKPFLWEKHWRRLTENASKIGLDVSEFSEAKVKNAVSEIIVENKLENGRARITFFDESAGKIWSFATNRKTSLLITTNEFRAAKDLRLNISAFPINSKSPLANVKSCNYLENILALEDAKYKGFDESIRLNERGEIASACMANLFWIKSGKILTPSLETGCLAGTTREFLLENYTIEEKIASLDELNEANEIFLTSAGLGIGKICKFEEKILKSDVTKCVEKEFLSIKS